MPTEDCYVYDYQCAANIVFVTTKVRISIGKHWFLHTKPKMLVQHDSHGVHSYVTLKSNHSKKINKPITYNNRHRHNSTACSLLSSYRKIWRGLSLLNSRQFCTNDGELMHTLPNLGDVKEYENVKT